MIDWIEKWYKSNCDGNWEHNQVIKIESLDNPGWNVEIDFNYTEVDLKNVPWKLYEISETDWIGYSITENVFNSSGDPLKLNLILTIFKRIIEKGKLEDGFIDSQIKIS